MNKTTNIRNDWNGNSYETITLTEFANRINNQITTYEVINDVIKFNFDIDFYCQKSDFDIDTANFIETECEKYIYDSLFSFSNIKPNILKANSHTNNYDETRAKYSVRLYVTNIAANKNDIKQFVIDLNQQLIKQKVELFDVISNNDNKIFDESIYNHLKKIRCINTSKPNENRPLKLINGSIIDTCLNDISNCQIIQYKKSVSPTSVTQFESISNTEKSNDYINMFLEYASLVDKSLIGTHIGNRNNRFKFIMAFKNCNIPIEYLHQIMNDCPNNDENINNATYNQQSTGNKLVGLSTIKKMAYESNPIKTLELNEKYKMEDDLYSPLFSSALVADYFIKLHGEIFKTVDGYVYHFNGIYWECDTDKKNNPVLSKFIDKTFVLDLLNYCNNVSFIITKKISEKPENEEQLKSKLEKVNKLRDNINSMRKGSVRKSIMEDIIIFSTDNSIIFDQKPFLFAFKNCIFDLNTGKQIQPNPKDYISKTCGYNYDENYDVENRRKELNELFNQIFPDSSIMNYYLQCASTGLCGLQIENLIINTGIGGNGKSVLNSLMLKTLGEYAFVLQSSILLNEIKTGPNPEVANLDGIRFALTSEPNSKKKICCSTLKEITGNPTLNVRKCYSDKCSISLNLTLFMECNDKPHLDEVNEAMNRRIRMILFESLYTDQDTLDSMTDKTNVYIANPYYKTDDFKNTYKQALFHILLDYFNNFKMNGYKLQEQPSRCKSLCKEFMATSDDIFGWFSEVYSPVEVEKSEPIALTDIYKVFSSSSFYENLSKADKRNYNRKNFIEKIEKNIFLKRNVILRKKYHNKKMLDCDSIVGWVKNENANENKLDE